ncbi:MAG TPA: flagellar motor switch phosphatase FliY [Clostridiales bacterium]|nr:flagellar motor switch phosphatase FliY [Clostridiales bacterium]
MDKEILLLTPEELDTIGEIMNISIGASATALSTMLEKQVTITAPETEQEQFSEIDCSDLEPAVIVKIRYLNGLEGVNVIMFRRSDMQIILDLLMGNEEPVTPDDFVFDEMSLSAASEVMNQMMGAAATALAEILHVPINISTPETQLVETKDETEEAFSEIRGEDQVVSINFNLMIKGVLNTTFRCFLPINLARRVVSTVSGEVEHQAPQKQGAQEGAAGTSSTAQPPVSQPMPSTASMPREPVAAQYAGTTAPPYQPPVQQPMQPPAYQTPAQQVAGYQTQQPGYYQPINPPQAPNGSTQYTVLPPNYGPYDPAQQVRGSDPRVDVRSAAFPGFSPNKAGEQAPYSSNMKLLLGVQLEVSVIIGRTKRKIKDIMDFGQGTVVLLDTQTGSPAEIFVNGQLLAYGDVVVVGDNFGVRITEIVGAKELMESLGSE